MTSPILYEQWFTGDFLVSEAPGRLSRDSATMTNSGTVAVYLNAGLVVTNAPGVTSGVSNANTHGAVSAVSLGIDVVPGAYVATATSPTTFAVTDSTGRPLGTATVGTAFSSSEIGFTITAGGGTFADGDTFSIQALGVGVYAPYTSTSGPASALLFDRAYIQPGATAGVTLITRNAEVNGAEVQWDASITAAANGAALQAEAFAALAQRNIIAR